MYGGYTGTINIICNIATSFGWTVLRADGSGWKLYYPTGEEQDWTVDFALSQMDRSIDDGSIERLCFVAQTEAAGTGLELSAAPAVIFYSNSNNGAARMQAEDRPHSNNMDKDRGLVIKDYCHLPSDYTIRESLLNKKDLQAISMGQLKNVYKEDISEIINKQS